MLNKEQQQAVKHYLGPALVLAVPGAGKTTVLLHRIKNLIKNHKINPNRILSITFSRASAMDMKNRFNSSFPQLTGHVQFSTIHSFAFFIVRDYARHMGKSYKLIEDFKDPVNKYSILKEIYYKYNSSFLSEDKMDTIINAIGYVKNMMASTSILDKFDIAKLDHIFKDYEEFKESNNYIDFDDMLTLSYKILKNKDEILNFYQNKYDFIQLDEGQDTSKIQLEIIKLLAKKHNNLFIVADDDQSIYGFRGAYPQGLMDFKNSFENAKIFFMQENFRSSKNIVKASNNLIKNNSKRFNKKIFTNNDYLEPVSIVRVSRVEDQYDYIIKNLKKHSNGSSAVLFRNNISAIGLIDRLERENIDFNIKDKNLKFFNHWVVYDILNILRFAQDTSNLKLYDRIFYKKKGYISRNQVNFAAKLNSETCVFKRMKQYPGLKNYQLKNLNELELDFKKLSSLKPSLAIDYIKYNLEYVNRLKDQCELFNYNYKSLLLILDYIELIAKGTESLEDFKDRLLTLKNLCKNNNMNSSLTLTTIHSAKGLEFDRVYLIDLIDEEFPSGSSIRSLDQGIYDEFEEERRLFYVALTRAKFFLTLFIFDKVENERILPSRFIKELS